MEDLHTLVIAGVHKAEHEFGKDVLNHYREHWKNDNDTMHLHLIKKASTYQSGDATRPYSEMLGLVDKLRPRLVLDVHCGGSYSNDIVVELCGDSLRTKEKLEYDSLQKDLEDMGFLYHSVYPRNKFFADDTRFVWEGIEATLIFEETPEQKRYQRELEARYQAEWEHHKELKGDKLREHMERAKIELERKLIEYKNQVILEVTRTKDESYWAAVSKTSQLTYSLHNYLKQNPNLLGIG